jgi:hypothetical protein
VIVDFCHDLPICGSRRKGDRPISDASVNIAAAWIPRQIGEVPDDHVSVHALAKRHGCPVEEIGL